MHDEYINQVYVVASSSQIPKIRMYEYKWKHCSGSMQIYKPLHLTCLSLHILIIDTLSFTSGVFSSARHM